MNVTETIKKVMGWCPNANAIKERKSVQFVNPNVTAPQMSGELPKVEIRQWRKYRNIILSISILGTFSAINMFSSFGRNIMDIFAGGVFLSILICAATWNITWHSLDRITSRTVYETDLKHSVKRVIVFCGLIILYIIVIIYLMPFYGWKNIIAFLLGWGVSMFWLSYFQVTYWEKKNGKILYKPGYFKPPIAIINPGNDE